MPPHSALPSFISMVMILATRVHFYNFLKQANRDIKVQKEKKIYAHSHCISVVYTTQGNEREDERLCVVPTYNCACCCVWVCVTEGKQEWQKTLTGAILDSLVTLFVVTSLSMWLHIRNYLHKQIHTITHVHSHKLHSTSRLLHSQHQLPSLINIGHDKSPHLLPSVESFINWAVAADVIRDCYTTLKINISDCFITLQIGLFWYCPLITV